MKALLMLHDDWELRGDGSGDIRKLMFDPAKKVLDICDLYDAKYTFFAEFGQQLAMLNSPNRTHRKDANEWEKILQDAVSRGHDVQLHFHPQWIDATFIKNKWRLNYSKWALSSLNEGEMDTWISHGIKYLRGLLEQSNPNYKTVAFRAGGWMNQPSDTIIKVLKKNKIIADVTIIKGLQLHNTELGSIDFSHAPSNIVPWYSDKNDFCKRGNNQDGILCIPTYSIKLNVPSVVYELINNPFAVKYVYKRLKSRKNEYNPIYTQAKKNNQKSSLFRERYISLDFGNTHYSTLENQANQLFKCMRKQKLEVLPLIMLTHSKNFYSYENFKKLLNKLSKMKHIEFASTQQTVNIIGQIISQ